MFLLCRDTLVDVVFTRPDIHLSVLLCLFKLGACPGAINFILLLQENLRGCLVLVFNFLCANILRGLFLMR